MTSIISSFVTSSGLKVAHIYRSDSLNTSISLRVLAGSIYESFDEIGVAHFLEHIVSDGTKKYPNKKSLVNLIEEKGGFRNASTNKETIEYLVKVLKEDSEVAFEYLSEIVINPLIKDEDIEKQKKIIEQEILRFKANPEEFSQRLIYSVVFPNTRLGKLNTGDVDDIKKINRKTIMTYHEKTHVANNMILVVSGNLSLEETKVFAERYFKSIKSSEKIQPVDSRSEPITEPQFELKTDSKQSILNVAYKGFNSNDNRKYVLNLIFRLLLRGSNSRLFNEIREKRALAYSVSGSNAVGRNHGMFSIRVGISKDKIPECLNIINTELNKITSENISKDELAKSLAFIKAGQAFLFEDSLSEASYYSNLWCSSGEIQPFEEELKKYQLTSGNIELIQNTAKEIFSNNPSILIIGPR
jgi:predicted Zn-dependent peptidase